MVVRHGSVSDADSAIHFCLETLSEALPGFPCVGPLQAMFCDTVVSSGHQLPSNVDTLLGGRNYQTYSREDKLDCCQRLTYAQPVGSLVQRLDPEISWRFEEEWKAFIEAHGSDDGVDDLQQTNSRDHVHSDEEEMTFSSSRAISMDIQSVINPMMTEKANST